MKTDIAETASEAAWKRDQAANLAGLAEFGNNLSRMLNEELPRFEAEVDSLLSRWEELTCGDAGKTNWYIAQKAMETKVRVDGAAVPAHEAVERIERLRKAFRRPIRASVGI